MDYWGTLRPAASATRNALNRYLCSQDRSFWTHEEMFQNKGSVSSTVRMKGGTFWTVTLRQTIQNQASLYQLMAMLLLLEKGNKGLIHPRAICNILMTNLVSNSQQNRGVKKYWYGNILRYSATQYNIDIFLAPNIVFFNENNDLRFRSVVTTVRLLHLHSGRCRGKAILLCGAEAFLQ